MKRLALFACIVAACQGAGAPDGEPAAVAGDPLAPQRIRLLTREEYRQTVLALFPQLGNASCEQTTDCVLTSQSCDVSTCVADPCSLHTFTLRGPSPGSSVVVAGAFNGWAPTAAQGATPLVYAPELDRWWAKVDLADGTWPYKFVIDGATWLADPENPATVDDNFGGYNSVIVQQCAGAAPPDGGFDPTAGFLPDARPEGFPFDNHAEAGVPSASRVEGWLGAGEAVSERLLSDPRALIGGDPADPAVVAAWLADLLPRAFRRAVSAAEIQRYAGLVAAGASPEEGLRAAVEAVLASPDLLYRPEVASDGRLRGEAVASLLSYWLWSSPPDDALRAAAAAGELDDAEGRRQAAARLLGDPRATATLGRFAEQWLGIEAVPVVDRSPALFPDLTGSLRSEMMAETRAVVARAVQEGGTLADLLGGGVTVAGPDLRALYGLPAGDGEVELPAERAGVLGHASVLLATSHSDQSSPIRRGLFVRQRLLCEVFPTPPANAGGVPDVDPNATTRERFEQHSSEPGCNSCHRLIDPLGFGFEGFDAIGRARTTDAGRPIDDAGVLVDVEGPNSGSEAPFTDLRELGLLLAASEAAPRCMVAQATRFALGMEVDRDDPRLEPLVADFLASGGDLRALWLALAASDLLVERL